MSKDERPYAHAARKFVVVANTIAAAVCLLVALSMPRTQSWTVEFTLVVVAAMVIPTMSYLLIAMAAHLDDHEKRPRTCGIAVLEEMLGQD